MGPPHRRLHLPDPLVIKAEYYFGVNSWWAFLVAGFIFMGLSVLATHSFLSIMAGVIAFSCFWSILEVFDQEKRVKKGWFPANPKRAEKKKKKA